MNHHSLYIPDLCGLYLILALWWNWKRLFETRDRRSQTEKEWAVHHEKGKKQITNKKNKKKQKH